MLHRKLYLNKIKPFIDTELIKVITGMRRSGKSVFLQQIQEFLLANGINKEQIFYLNFEQMENAHLTNAVSLHNKVLETMENCGGRAYLFFDEIQEVQNWEKCINSLRLDLDCDIYITGSNAKLLSSELATYLAGRYVEIVVYPFSFAEFKEIYSALGLEMNLALCFGEYLKKGGMPFLAQLAYKEEPGNVYLKGLYSTIELKDIIQRTHIRDVELLLRILAYLTQNPGTPFTANSLVKYFKSEGRKVSLETITNYIQVAKDAFLFYPVAKEDIQGKKMLKIYEKYYLADHGIRQAVFGNNLQVINLILENIVCLELLRRDYKVSFGKVGEKEIDFIGVKAGKKIYIQVAYLLATTETMDREFAPLLAVRDNYPKYVVSMDEIDFSQKGICHLPIREFLLKADW